MVKKQTVWLLTMLSLLIVLSVYYMTSPDNGEMAFIQDDEWQDGENVEEGTTEDVVTSELSTDELFASIRLEKQNERDQKSEQLSEIVASSDYSAEEKNDAMEEMETLQETSSKESILENTIRASIPYEDVLVRAEDEVIQVTVQAEELTKSETREIMQMVSDEFGQMRVEVKFQPTS
ncbi:stage III sporulation protein AH [Halobacillus andaensis]|uniref:Stage III sporulation protein AH n=1 Tax=Halobacillus andaensis TaxID=1176239 RepID=A0A917EUR6_HALAA|nr:SpoIIIAH-like family protein [Halobacillus andaensis]MBP2003134.1 stage III sporulation protein AH [Halobacillus andaensis]GGF08310.1 stage III sporulation protein AH [Halobacillus andaensis]